MFFTKFSDKEERKGITPGDLSKHRYFLVIHLAGDYLNVSDNELVKLKIYLWTLDDYFAIIIKQDEDSALSEALDVLTQGFEKDQEDSYIGAVLLENIDNKTKTLKIVVNDLPKGVKDGERVNELVWEQLESLVDYDIPLRDTKNMKSVFTFDLLLKSLKLLGLV